MSLFFANAFQTHFSRISFEKVRRRQSPNAFLQVANRMFEHQSQKSYFAGHRFFLAIFVPIAFLRLLFGGLTSRVKRNCVAFLSMRPPVNRIFQSFGIRLSRWSRVSMHVAPFVACRPGAVVQKAIVVAKNAAKRVLPETGSWPEGKVSQYSHILCAVVQ